MSHPQAPTALEAVLFDLDGTLVDTAPDLAYAVNATLAEEGLAPLPYAHIRPQVSNGSTALTRLAFGIEPDHPSFEPRRARLLDIYRENIARESRLFPGTDALLECLERWGLRWGVVTNKPAWLTEPLLEELGLAARAACIVSGDTTARRKPHPEPLLHAARLVGADTAACLYVGDAERDVAAARGAGMVALVAAFGYLEPGAQPSTWGAAALLDSPAAIGEWIEREHARRRPGR